MQLRGASTPTPDDLQAASNAATAALDCRLRAGEIGVAQAQGDDFSVTFDIEAALEEHHHAARHATRAMGRRRCFETIDMRFTW